jgi:membrane protein YqaA with SNARE-associated domain
LLIDAAVLLGVGFAGTFFWPLSPEGWAAVYATQRSPLVIALLLASGQAGAHVTLFLGGDQLRRRWPWFERKCARAVARHGHRLKRRLVPLACLSGLLGLPPSSVTAALAPGLGLRARALLPLLFVMRVVRFGAVAYLTRAGVTLFRH